MTDPEIVESLLRAAASHLGLTLGDCLHAEEDRAYFEVGPEIRTQLRRGVWGDDPHKGKGHDMPCFGCDNRSGVAGGEKCRMCGGSGKERGWERTNSRRSNTYRVSMQAVLHRRLRTVECPECEGSGDSTAFEGEDCGLCHGHGDIPVNGSPPSPGDYDYVVELDLDRKGIHHIGDVIHNKVTGDKTDLIRAAQEVAFYWGLVLPFDLRLKR